MRFPTMLYERPAKPQSDQSLCLSLEYSINVKLLSEHHLEFLSLKGGCTGLSVSTLVKMSHFWKSHVTAHLILSIGFKTYRPLQKIHARIQKIPSGGVLTTRFSH